MTLRTFVSQFKCSSALSASPSLQTHLHIFLPFSLPSPSPSLGWVSFPLLCPSLVTPCFPPLFPFGSCNTWWFFGEINLSKPHLPCRASSRLQEERVRLWDARRSSLPFVFSSPSYSFPAYRVFCSPFIRSSQVNFINVGVEQMLKAIQDFVFLFLILWVLPFPPPPMRKTFCVTSIKFGTKPLTRAVVSEK